jgi:hypothetical protein
MNTNTIADPAQRDKLFAVLFDPAAALAPDKAADRTPDERLAAALPESARRRVRWGGLTPLRDSADWWRSRIVAAAEVRGRRRDGDRADAAKKL